MTGTYGDRNRYTSSTPHSCPLFPDPSEGETSTPCDPQKSTEPTSRGRRHRLRTESRERKPEPRHFQPHSTPSVGGAATHRRGSPQTQTPASPSRRVVAETTAVNRLPWQRPDSFKLQRGIKDGPVHWPRTSATWDLIGPGLGGGALDRCEGRRGH